MIRTEHSPLPSLRAAAVMCAAGLLLAACDRAPATDDGAATAMSDTATELSPTIGHHVVDVAAGDFYYTMVDTVVAGATTFRLSDIGEELHHLQLVRLADGKTAEDFVAESKGEVPPAWAEFVGGPNSPTPNAGVSTVTVNLTPGNYLALCVIPSPDGKPHVVKGMSKSLAVISDGNPAGMPATVDSVALTDYDFVFSRPLTAGQHLLTVTNTATQPHEIFIAKLNDGASVDDLIAWTGTMAGPPPGMAVGGTVGLSMGMSNVVHLDLTPGNYALICFVPDAKDGQPHFVHGMKKQIRVM